MADNYSELMKLLKLQQEPMQSQEVMSKMTPEQSNELQSQMLNSKAQQEIAELPPAQPETEPAGLADLRLYDESLSPQKVKEELKRGVASSTPDPTKSLRDMLQQRLSASDADVEKAKKEDKRNAIINGILNSLSSFSQARAIKEGGTFTPKMEAMQIPTDKSKLAISERDKMTQQALQKLQLDRQARQDSLNEEYRKAQIEALQRKGEEGGMTPVQRAQLDLAKQRLAETQEDRMRKAEQFRESLSDRNKEQLDKKVADVSKRVEKSGILERSRAMKEIERYLGSEYSTDLDNPKSVDIGGIGLGAGLRPDFMTSKGDVSFRQNVQGLANQLLKARSGAAVTDQEYARFLKEIGSGNFSSESNLMDGLRKMRDDIKSQTGNIVKNYGDEITQEYLNRVEPDLYLDSAGTQPEKSAVTAPYGETVERNGKKYKWNPSAGKYQIAE